MKKCLITVLLVFLLKNCFSFDGKKKGFILGFNLGKPTLYNKYSAWGELRDYPIDIELRVGTRGEFNIPVFATSIRLGYHFNDRTGVFISNHAIYQNLYYLYHDEYNNIKEFSYLSDFNISALNIQWKPQRFSEKSSFIIGVGNKYFWNVYNDDQDYNNRVSLFGQGSSIGLIIGYNYELYKHINFSVEFLCFPEKKYSYEFGYNYPVNVNVSHATYLILFSIGICGY